MFRLSGVITGVMAAAVMLTTLPFGQVAAAGNGLLIGEKDFPSYEFRVYLLSEVDKDHNGLLSDKEISDTKKIDFPAFIGKLDDDKIELIGKNGWLDTLKGIERFKNLETLIATEQLLKEIDISKNANLKVLNVGINEIKKLDVSKNTKLTELSAFECGNLTELDVSKNKNLKELNINYCPIKKLDVTKNTKLTSLSCIETNIKSLDLTGNTALKAINIPFYGMSKIVVAAGSSMSVNDNAYYDLTSSDEKIAKIGESRMDSKCKCIVNGKQAGHAALTVKCREYYNEPDPDHPGSSKMKWKYTDWSGKLDLQVLYKDVKDASKFWYEPTNTLTNKGVVKGYDKQTTFKPDNQCTRAQMVTFLWRLKGSPAPKSKTLSFKDVKKGDYYYDAVVWAVEKGITTGVSKTKFDPSGVCTRGQTVTFLWRMAGKPSVGSAKNPFKDVKKSNYFYDAVIWAAGKKIVAGYSNGTFKPSGKCTRRQMVTFLYKYDKFVNGKG